MPFSPRARRAAVVLATLAVGLTPTLLFAHARLTRSSPSANARLERAPEWITLWFSEHPEPRFTSVQLLDSSGAAIALGNVATVTGDPSGVTLHVGGAIAAGTYTVVWRTAAADGHPSTGRFQFTVAAIASAAPAPPVSPGAMPATNVQSNPLVGVPARGDGFDGMGSAERWAELIALLTIIGAVIFRGSVLPAARLPDAVATDALDRARRLAQGALVLALVASVTRLASEALLVTSGGGVRAWVEVARDTQWGHGWLVGAVGILIAGAGLSLARTTPRAWLIAAAGVVALALSQPLTGHAIAAPEMPGLAVASDFIHLGATGAWIGGLFVIVLAGLPSVNLAPEEERAAVGQRLVRAYHRVAVVSVALAVFTGVINAKFRLGAWGALWTSDYGRVLTAKTAVVLVLLAFGAYHWKNVVVADWPSAPAARFRMSAAGEIVAGAIVLAITAILVSTGLPHQ